MNHGLPKGVQAAEPDPEVTNFCPVVCAQPDVRFHSVLQIFKLSADVSREGLELGAGLGLMPFNDRTEDKVYTGPVNCHDADKPHDGMVMLEGNLPLLSAELADMLHSAPAKERHSTEKADEWRH